MPTRSPGLYFCKHCLEGDHKSEDCALSPAALVVPYAWSSQQRMVQAGREDASSRRVTLQKTDACGSEPGFAHRTISNRVQGLSKLHVLPCLLTMWQAVSQGRRVSRGPPVGWRRETGASHAFPRRRSSTAPLIALGSAECSR